MIGAACALRLQSAGFAVTLIDPGDQRRAASFGNAGHIATEQVSPWASWRNLRTFPGRLFGVGGALDFRWRDIGAWAPWSIRFLAACRSEAFLRGEHALTGLLADAMPAWRRLAHLAGRPDIIRANGHNVVWMTSRGADAGRSSWERAKTGVAEFRAMTPDELDRYAPVVRAPPVAGLSFSGTGQVSEPQAARDALLNAFVQAGGETQQGSIAGLSAGRHVIARRSGGGVHESDAVVVCAGAWSARLMGAFDVRAPLIGERGYSVQSRTHAWPADLPPTVFEERSVIVSRFVSGLRASSYLEFGAPDAPADPRKWRRLQRHIRELGVQFDASPDCWVGPRPTLPDYLPAIGRLRTAGNVFYAFGHQHLGVTLAAVTAEKIEALVNYDQAMTDADPFRIERFS